MAADTLSMSFPKLGQDNFKAWIFNVNILLCSQGLNEFTSNEEKLKEKVDGDGKVIDEDKNKLRSQKALALICLSMNEEIKSIVYQAEDPFDAWKLLKAAYEPSSRARVASLRRKFMEVKFNPAEIMSSYINRVLETVKDLEQVGKVMPADEVAFQIIEHLPSSYENLIRQL